MPHAIVIRRTGGVDELRIEEITQNAPTEGKVTIQQTAIGVNHTDINHRNGNYPLKMPFIPGTEAVGVITDLGAGVTEFNVGDRVVYATGPVGSYRESRNVLAEHVVKIPDEVSDIAVAACFSKGLMAHTLVKRVYMVVPNSKILVHAASSAIGVLIAQWANHLGAEVIGTVGTKEKESIAIRYGCTYVINYNEYNFVEEVRAITNGQGVPVVYDPVGKETFYQSLSCLHMFGTMVSYGQTSGKVMPVNIDELSKKSLFLTRPNLKHYKRSRSELLQSSQELFSMIKQQHIRPVIGKRYEGLENMAKAHADIESRKIVGSAVITLKP